jgi:hypothetical protein
MTLIGLRTPPHQSCRGYGAGRYVKSFHLFGWRICLALPGCHLQVVHGVSTPYEEAKNSPFVHNENSIYGPTKDAARVEVALFPGPE